MNALRRTVLAGALTSVTFAALATPARADSRDEARELVYKGDDLFAAQHFDEALSAYLRAQEIYDAPSTRIEVARTLHVLGRWTEAYVIALGLQDGAGSEPEAFQEARVSARELARILKAKIPSILVTAPSGVSDDALTIRSGTRRFPGKIGVSILVDPGTYAVERDGAETITVSVVEGEHCVISSRPASALAPAPDSRTTNARRLSPLVVGGIVASGVGLTLGTIAGSIYLVRRGTLVTDCAAGSSACTPSAVRSTDAIGWTADVGFGVAVAGGGFALVTALVDRHGPAKTKSDGVMLSPGFVGYRGSF